MLIVDDILSFPVRGLFWIFEEIQNAAEQELREEAGAITLELQQLYAGLESGRVTEADCDRREAELLDRLSQIQENGSLIDEDEEEDS